jgi:SecD/SecF fusion protein
VLAALLLLGGDTLANFSLALIVGILVGTYSSVFVATPLAVVLERRWGVARDETDDDHADRPPEPVPVSIATIADGARG